MFIRLCGLPSKWRTADLRAQATSWSSFACCGGCTKVFRIQYCHIEHLPGTHKWKYTANDACIWGANPARVCCWADYETTWVLFSVETPVPEQEGPLKSWQMQPAFKMWSTGQKQLMSHRSHVACHAQTSPNSSMVKLICRRSRCMDKASKDVSKRWRGHVRRCMERNGEMAS